MQAIIIVIGFIILVAGHLSVRLFSAIVGFVVAGFFLIPKLALQSQIELLSYCLVAAATAAILGYIIKKPMRLFSSFIACMYLAYSLPGIFGIQSLQISTPVIALVGLIGAVIVYFLGTIPLILISAGFGASIISRWLKISDLTPLLLFLSFFAIGAIAQWILWHYNRPETD